MEEERARQEAAAKRAADEAARQGKGEEASSNTQDATMTENVTTKAADATEKASDPMVGLVLLLMLFGVWPCCRSTMLHSVLPFLKQSLYF